MSQVSVTLVLFVCISPMISHCRFYPNVYAFYRCVVLVTSLFAEISISLVILDRLSEKSEPTPVQTRILGHCV